MGWMEGTLGQTSRDPWEIRLPHKLRDEARAEAATATLRAFTEATAMRVRSIIGVETRVDTRSRCPMISVMCFALMTLTRAGGMAKPDEHPKWRAPFQRSLP